MPCFRKLSPLKNLGFVIVDEQQRFWRTSAKISFGKGKSRRSFDDVSNPDTKNGRSFLVWRFGCIQYQDHAVGKKTGKDPVCTRFQHETHLKRVVTGNQRRIARVCGVPSIEENEETSLRSVQSIYEGMKKDIKGCIDCLATWKDERGSKRGNHAAVCRTQN